MNSPLSFLIFGKLCMKKSNYEIPVIKLRKNTPPSRWAQVIPRRQCCCSKRSFVTEPYFRLKVPLVMVSQTQEENKDPYSVLGVDSTASADDIRKAYVELSKTAHPDVHRKGEVQVDSKPTFHSLKEAYDILKEPRLRKIYDSLGWEGIYAVRRKQTRPSSQDSDQDDNFVAVEDSAWADYIAGEITTDTPLLEEAMANSVGVSTDACPRSVEEAVYNILYHENSGYRYYALWWISKNRVVEAEEALVLVLQTSQEQTALGGYPLKRRAAIALGNIGSVKAIVPLSNILSQTSDSFLSCVVNVLVDILTKEWKSFQQDDILSRDGTHNQMFQLEHLSQDVREKLENIFQQRKRNEMRQRRMTHTPNLGVGPEYLEYPLEWCLKALGFLHANEHLSLIKSYTEHPIPLVKYAAYKALYQCTGEISYLQPLLSALGFGEEHHYTQRVLIRDLGEVGYLPAAKEIAACPMVENSFKLFALRKLASCAGYDLSQPDMVGLLNQLDDML
ncbi:Phycocyanobilin lyase subunit alpha [Galdieria sulphuraria]|nr:Phycocyanobilin lyase subunit alpha [Galdieria sulphuraria]